MSDDTAGFGAVLRRLRIAAALSQDALAERAGLSLRGVSDLERGVRRTPHLATVGMLADALDLGPEDRQALLASARPERPSDPPEQPAAGFSPLPVPLTSLIGRERELEALVSLLDDGASRLVTLTGAGGSGTTRLAIEVGARLQPSSADGVVFVDLAPVRDADLVAPAIAGALGVRERVGQRLQDTLAGVLAEKEMALVLDNCEQVLGAAPAIAALLSAAPRLTVLATSREPLRARGERVFPLLPLPLPDDDLPATEYLARVPAVALFVERAAASQPDFALTAGNTAAVVAICRRLDGLPLAIELAAARARMLPPDAMLARLEQRLPFLTGGARDAPPRQRTMRDAIAWSYDLLNEAEQRLFRRLAVFAGGWTLEAAETVVDHDGALDGRTLECLERLADASLLQRCDDRGGILRFSMLETVREFAREIGDVDETRATSWSQVVWCRRLAEKAEPMLFGAAQQAWLEQLDLELANIRAALHWALDAQQECPVLAIAGALREFWDIRAYYAEGLDWIQRALAQSELCPGRAKALLTAANLALWRGDLDRARAFSNEGLRIARETGDEQMVGYALTLQGNEAESRANYEDAVRLSEASLDIFRRLDDPQGVSTALINLAIAVGNSGDLSRAVGILEELLVVAHANDDKRSADIALLKLAEFTRTLGDRAAAHIFATEGLRLAQEVGDRSHHATALTTLGLLAADDGDVVRAAHLLGDALGFVEKLGHREGAVWVMEYLAMTVLLATNATAALRLYAAASAHRQSIAAPLPPDVRLRDEQNLIAARAGLGDAVYQAAWSTGGALTWNQAIGEALSLAHEVTRGRPGAASDAAL
jgi:predicted ATPase/DNA-binding XRE family transcriptional regulator